MMVTWWMLSLCVVWCTTSAGHPYRDVVEHKQNGIQRDESEVQSLNVTREEISDGVEKEGVKIRNRLRSPRTFIIRRSYSEEHVDMSQGNQLAAFSQIGKEFSISFDFVPSHMRKDDNFANVLHITNGTDDTRNPAIWFRVQNAVNYLHVVMHIDGIKRFYLKPEAAIEVGKKVHIRVSQNLFDDKYVFIVAVNGVAVWAVPNPNPRVVKNVQLYCANPWYYVQEGTMSNLEVLSS